MIRRAGLALVLGGAAWMAMQLKAQPLYSRVEGSADTLVAYAPLPGKGPLAYERLFCTPLPQWFAVNPHLAMRWDTVRWRAANPFVQGMAVDSALRRYPQWARRWTIRYFLGIPRQAVVWIPWRNLAACPTVPDSLMPAHRVQPGDTWYAVARRYGVPLDSLYAWNPGIDRRLLPVGAWIWRIPPALPMALPPSPKPPSRVSEPILLPPRFHDTLEGKASWLTSPDTAGNEPLAVMYAGLRSGTIVWVESLNTERRIRAKVIAPPPLDAPAEILITGRLAALLGEQRPFFRLRLLVP